MKKKHVAILVICMSLILLLGGCGNKKIVSEGTPGQMSEIPEKANNDHNAGTEMDAAEAPSAKSGNKDPNHKHEYQISTVAATCTAKGYTLHKCACGDSYQTDETAALGHDYQTGVVDATTDSQGYTLHTCSRCSDSYKDNYTEKKAVDHWTLEGGISAYDPIVKEYARNYNPQQAADAGNAYIQSLGLAYNPGIDTSSADHTDISFGGDQIWLQGGQAWYNGQAKELVEYTKNYLDKELAGGSGVYQFYCTASCGDYTPMYKYGVTVWYTFK